MKNSLVAILLLGLCGCGQNPQILIGRWEPVYLQERGREPVSYTNFSATYTTEFTDDGRHITTYDTNVLHGVWRITNGALVTESEIFFTEYQEFFINREGRLVLALEDRKITYEILE